MFLKVLKKFKENGIEIIYNITTCEKILFNKIRISITWLYLHNYFEGNKLLVKQFKIKFWRHLQNAMQKKNAWSMYLPTGLDATIFQHIYLKMHYI